MVRYEGRYVPARLLDRYRQLVSDVTQRGTNVLAAQVAAAGMAGQGESSADTLKAVVRTTLAAADAEVSEVDRQYYIAARKSVTDEEWTASRITDSTWEAEADRAIDAMLREYGDYDPLTGLYTVREGEEDRFASDLSQFFGRMVNDRSKHYVERYGQRDSLRPRYARVPSGVETCAYCYALAGLGFQYRSAESARAHGHANCDCAIVPSWGGSGVEGYDSEYYADLFRSARDWLNSADAPAELVERVNRMAREEPGYTRGWRGVLAAMRQQGIERDGEHVKLK